MQTEQNSLREILYDLSAFGEDGATAEEVFLKIRQRKRASLNRKDTEFYLRRLVSRGDALALHQKGHEKLYFAREAVQTSYEIMYQDR